MNPFRCRYRIVQNLVKGDFTVQFRLFFMIVYSDIYGNFDTLDSAEQFIKKCRSKRILVKTDKEI